MKSKGIVEGIEFRDSTHRYFYKGAEMLGVTTSFKLTGIVDFSKVKSEVIEPALIEGDNVHEMARIYGLNKMSPGEYAPLDIEDLDPTYSGYLKAIENFFAENVKEVLLIEQVVCDPYNLYCGQLDILYRNFKNRICLKDYKTPKKPHPAWGWQTAGYKNAVLKCFKDLKVDQRGGVLLKNNGKYEIHLHKSATDLDYFLANMKVSKFKIQHRIKT